MSNRVAHFVASFIVSKKGVADSLQFLENVDAEFDKRFVKVFNKARQDSKPAVLNGKFVNVKMMIDLRYSTSETTIPAYFAAQKALAAFNNKNYEVAEYFYNKAIETEPQDKQSIYQRGMCKYLFGNKSGACEDWNKAKALGSNTTIETVMTKFCY